jgi:VWFA-related protein
VKNISIGCGVLLAVVTCVSAPNLRARSAVEPITRTVYVSVLDNKGVALGDLTDADFAVKENGKDYPLVKVELAKAPMQLAIVVDDNGTGVFRPTVAALVQGLLTPGSEVQIVTVLRQVTRVTEFTSNVDALRTAITGLVARPGSQDGSLPVDGVLESLKDLGKKKATRPVVVLFTVSAADKSLSQSSEVMRQLKQTMASLHALALGNSLVSSASGGGMDQINLNQVLDDGPKQSGGKRHSLTATLEVTEAVKKVVDQLTHQYALTYALPDGVKMNERLQVSVKRSGATVLAPTKIADR